MKRPATWDRSAHAWPCPETDRIDAVLNEMERWTWRLSESELSECFRIGRRRQDIHRANSTERFFHDAYSEQMVGVKGELAWERLTGMKMDRNTYGGGGDAGYDFKTASGLTLDVKTAHRPTFIFLKAADSGRGAQILVQARLYQDEVVFLGWARREDMVRRPTRDFGYGIANYFLPVDEAQPMRKLSELGIPEARKA